MNKYISILCLLFFVSSCIDEITLDVESEDPVLVVDGLLTNILEIQTIRLSLSGGVSVQSKEVIRGAEVYVENQDGSRVLFAEQDDGSYATEMEAVPGQQYRLYAILSDGRILTSNLQEVPASFPINDIVFADTLVNVLNEDGNEQRLNALDFYAKGNSSSVTENKYLRFSYETVFQVREFMCSPFITPRTCYVYNDQPPNGVNLLKINPSETPVGYEQFVYRRRVNSELGEVFSLDLYLYSYNQKEFEYWENIKTIFEQDGSITDSQPARAIGNITASDGSEILGQFAVVGKTSKTLFVTNTDFVAFVYPFCGLPGSPPNPLPQECCDCLNFDGAIYDKPDYWP